MHNFITRSKISKWLCQVSTVVHNITDRKDLSRYSVQFFQVTAAVLVHQAGKGSAYIQLRICWVSDAFIMYLRSTPEITEQHTQAVGTEHTRVWALRLNPNNVTNPVEPTVDIDPYGPKQNPQTPNGPQQTPTLRQTPMDFY